MLHFVRVFTLATVAGLGASQAIADTQTFVWDSKSVDYGKRTPRAILQNESIVEERTGQHAFDQSIAATSLDGKQRQVVVKNRHNQN